MHTGFWWGEQRERDHFEDLGVDGNITLKCIIKKVGWGGIDWIDLAQEKGQMAGACECGNELSGTLKCGEFLD